MRTTGDELAHGGGGGGDWESRRGGRDELIGLAGAWTRLGGDSFGRGRWRQWARSGRTGLLASFQVASRGAGTLSFTWVLDSLDQTGRRVGQQRGEPGPYCGRGTGCSRPLFSCWVWGAENWTGGSRGGGSPSLERTKLCCRGRSRSRRADGLWTVDSGGQWTRTRHPADRGEMSGFLSRGEETNRSAARLQRHHTATGGWCRSGLSHGGTRRGPSCCRRRLFCCRDGRGLDGWMELTGERGCDPKLELPPVSVPSAHFPVPGTRTSRTETGPPSSSLRLGIRVVVAVEGGGEAPARGRAKGGTRVGAPCVRLAEPKRRSVSGGRRQGLALPTGVGSL